MFNQICVIYLSVGQLCSCLDKSSYENVDLFMCQDVILQTNEDKPMTNLFKFESKYKVNV